MKKNTFLALFVAGSALLTACGGGGSAEKGGEKEKKAEKKEKTEMKDEKSAKEMTMMVDTSQSKAMWAGTLVGVYTHTGNVMLEKGMLTAKGDKITGGEFVIDMNSMVATDDNYNPEEDKTPEKLIGHLQADDFFAVKNHPTASFKIKSYDEASNTITGDLTVRGKTQEEKITDVKFNAEEGTAKGKLVFDRHEYDVAYTMSMKDMTINDEIEVMVDLKLNPKS
ncbi:YceI family protein [Salibacter sp.]|uniref:YceI family protein n=1 Tax=Salibacter sp. TaxID=2010995 RepID=UPI0028704F8F|nr:YceI family protein [Salibacter sp.]MDR9398921.1 YceI family protein [Salibacter sp.]MDR9487162.1 YceI family protein [Salibacter sp.]